MRKLKILILTLMLLSVAISGCESKWGTALLGGAGGAAAAGGGYEYKAKKELDRIQQARDNGEMTEQEYLIRKDQIERMVILE